MNNQANPPEGSGSKSLSAMKSGGNLLPIYPQSIDEVYRFSQMAVRSGVLKPVIRRQKIEATGKWEDVFENDEAMVARGSMIIAQGMEIGMPPLQALQLIMLVNGRLTVYAEGVPALLWSHGFKVKEWWVDNDGKHHETADGLGPVDTWTDRVAAYCRITRPNGDTITRAFSVGMAKTARLWDRRESIKKRGSNETYANDSAWFRFPDRLLRARAIGFCAKDGAADAMRGMMTSEEAIDIQRTQEERSRDALQPIEQDAPAISFDINLDLDTAPAPRDPEREQSAQKGAEEAEVIPNGNTEEHASALAENAEESDFPDGLDNEPEIVPDEEQELSRASEAKLIGQFAVKFGLSKALDEIRKIESEFSPYAGRISEDGRGAIIEAATEARKRVKR